MSSCSNCKKNGTKNRIIKDGLCNECTSNNNRTIEHIVSNLRYNDVEFNVTNMTITDLVRTIKAATSPLINDVDKLRAEFTRTTKMHENEMKDLKGRYDNLETKTSDSLDALRREIEAINSERILLKKIINEQQRFIEVTKCSSIKNNVFITGIPNSVLIADTNGGDGIEITDNNEIIQILLSSLVPSITKDKYIVLKSFNPREGYVVHSSLVAFTEFSTKEMLMAKCKMLKYLDEEHAFRTVFIKSEQPPMTDKENNRLYSEFKKLCDLHKGDNGMVIKLIKGKLYKNDVVIDEFNLTNQNL